MTPSPFPPTALFDHFVSAGLAFDNVLTYAYDRSSEGLERNNHRHRLCGAVASDRSLAKIISVSSAAFLKSFFLHRTALE